MAPSAGFVMAGVGVRVGVAEGVKVAVGVGVEVGGSVGKVVWVGECSDVAGGIWAPKSGVREASITCCTVISPPLRTFSCTIERVNASV